jgi:hypothetical protein
MCAIMAISRGRGVHAEVSAFRVVPIGWLATGALDPYAVNRRLVHDAVDATTAMMCSRTVAVSWLG